MTKPSPCSGSMSHLTLFCTEECLWSHRWTQSWWYYDTAFTTRLHALDTHLETCLLLHQADFTVICYQPEDDAFMLFCDDAYKLYLSCTDIASVDTEPHRIHHLC